MMAEIGLLLVLARVVLSRGGRSVAIPSLTVIETLVRLVSDGKVAHDIAEVREHLRLKDRADATVAEALSRKATAEAVAAENENRPERVAIRNRRLKAEAKAMEAEASEASARARERTERARRTALASAYLEQVMDDFRRRGGAIMLDQKQLERFLLEQALKGAPDDATPGKDQVPEEDE